MTGLKRQAIVLAVGVIAVLGQGLAPRAYGQAIAFIPVPGFVPNGSTMTVTPAVSPDRRYVRLTVTPFFNTVNGFQNFTTQLGAVGGGGAGGLAGMNGLIGQGGAGAAVGGGLGQGMMAGQSDYPLAGPYPVAGDFAGDPFAVERALEYPGAERPDSTLDSAADPASTPQRSAAGAARSRTGKKKIRAAASSSGDSGPSVRKPVPKSASGSRRRGYVRQIDPFLEMDGMN
jgi:hypothetical protein